jgi:hypothetical protein
MLLIHIAQAYMTIAKEHFDLISPPILSTLNLANDKDVISRSSQAWALCVISLVVCVASLAVVIRPLRIFRWIRSASHKKALIVLSVVLAVALSGWWCISYINYKMTKNSLHSNPFYPYLLPRTTKILERNDPFLFESSISVYIFLQEDDIQYLDSTYAKKLLNFEVLLYADFKEFDEIYVYLINISMPNVILAKASQEFNEKIQYDFTNFPNK